MIEIFSRQHSQRTASVLVFAASSMWGLLWVPMRFTESMGVAPLWVQFWFTTMPALFLAGLLAPAFMRQRAFWPVYLISGLCIGIGYTLYAVGLLVGSVSKTTVLFYLTPIWSTLLGMVFLDENPGIRRWGAIGMATLGCCLVMQINPIEMQLEKVDLLGLLSGVSGAWEQLRCGGTPRLTIKMRRWRNMSVALLSPVQRSSYWGRTHPTWALMERLH